jgi:hypothetical protein
LKFCGETTSPWFTVRKSSVSDVVAAVPDPKLATAGSRIVAVRFTVCEPTPTAERT